MSGGAQSDRLPGHSPHCPTSIACIVGPRPGSRVTCLSRLHSHRPVGVRAAGRPQSPQASSRRRLARWCGKASVASPGFTRRPRPLASREHASFASSWTGAVPQRAQACCELLLECEPRCEPKTAKKNIFLEGSVEKVTFDTLKTWTANLILAELIAVDHSTC